MLFRYLVLLFLITAICAQKGGRRASASEVSSSIQRSPSRALAGRKLPQPSEPIQQVQEPDREEDKEPDEDREAVSAVRPSRPAPRPAFRPQPTEEEAHEPLPEPYSFSYSVDDPETGAGSSREESQDKNGEIKGHYIIKDGDRQRRVDYTAGKDGFKATIKSNEEGLNARAPADVNIELTPSASDRVQAFAPNNRPIASESSIKSFGRPIQERFFQKLVPAPIAPAPLPQPLEQAQEDTQISQTYESPSDSEITQQKNIDDEEVPFESAPVERPPTKGGAPLPPLPSPVSVPIDIPRATPPRPIGTFTPSHSQTFRERDSISTRPQLPNSIQDVQTRVPLAPAPLSPPASTKTYSSVPISPPRNYPALRPLSPLLGTAPLPLSPPPIATHTPTHTSYFHRSQPVAVLQPQTVPNLAPLSPPSNNIVFQQQHREPITQQQLLQFLHPLPQQSVVSTPEQPIVFDAPAPKPIQLFSALDNSGFSYFPNQPQQQTGGYSLTVQHRENQNVNLQPQPRQEFISQQDISSEEPEQRITTEYRIDSQELRPPPVPQPLPQISEPIAPIQYRPLPTLPLPMPQRQDFFEPQVYEPPTQQTYEPLQQELAEEPVEESRIEPPTPKCECNQQQQNAESRTNPIKGQASEPAPAAIKSGRLSPARNVNSFLPQAYRTR